MTDLLPLSVGIGLVVSLLLTEAFGLAAGGMIVPGYVALNLSRPLDVLVTLAVSLATYWLVHALSTILVVYGRRRTLFMILIGFALGMLMRRALPELAMEDEALTVIGYIIPGLIAIWFDRQGVVQTVTSLTVASVIVRLVLILVVGEEVIA